MEYGIRTATITGADVLFRKPDLRNADEVRRAVTAAATCGSAMAADTLSASSSER
jgi:hypothetical protein